MNLYEFSQVNNNEMGVFILRETETELYKDTFEEAQRLIRVSEEIRLAAETVEKQPEAEETASSAAEAEEKEQGAQDKLTTSRLAKERGLRTAELLDQLVAKGYLHPTATASKSPNPAKQPAANSECRKSSGHILSGRGR